MPKRKRSEGPDLEERLAKCGRDLFRAMKVAKAFEIQRLNKRMRDDKSTPEKVSRLQRELIVLKSLDLQNTAHVHLCSTLLRIKPIAESPELPVHYKRGVSKPEISEEEQAALHNVTSGLYNKNQVRDVLDAAVADVCRILRVAAPEKRSKGKKGGKDASHDEKFEERKPKSRDTLRQEAQHGAKGRSQTNGDVEDMSDDDASEDDVLSGEESAGDDDNASEFRGFSDEEAEEAAMSRFEALLGSSSDDSDSDDNNEDVSLPGSDSEYSSDEELVPPKAARSRAQKPDTATDSTFLPTLMGGYISGSESASDVDIAPALRKNRRGQKARQAIWEKKYGEKAKHLEKEKEVRWDPKRGAVGGSDGKPWKRGIRNPLEKAAPPKRNGDDESAAAQRKPAKQSKPQDTGPLHPSWEARKKAKERQQNASFQGKKVVFE